MRTQNVGIWNVDETLSEHGDDECVSQLASPLAAMKTTSNAVYLKYALARIPI